jgi:hypothetical protein
LYTSSKKRLSPGYGKVYVGTFPPSAILLYLKKIR